MFTKGTILKLTTAQNALQTNPFSRYCFQTQFSIQRRANRQSCNWAQNKFGKIGAYQNANLWLISDQSESLVQKLSESPVWKVIELKSGHERNRKLIEREGWEREARLESRGWERTELDWGRNTWLAALLMVNLPPTQKGEHQRRKHEQGKI